MIHVWHTCRSTLIKHTLNTKQYQCINIYIIFLLKKKKNNAFYLIKQMDPSLPNTFRSHENVFKIQIVWDNRKSGNDHFQTNYR